MGIEYCALPVAETPNCPAVRPNDDASVPLTQTMETKSAKKIRFIMSERILRFLDDWKADRGRF
jgi:hypothetical protein